MPTKVVLRTLGHIWLTLEPLKVPRALMGGLALAVWGHIRATRDVDLLVGIRPEDLSPMLETLARAQIRLKRQPPLLTLGQLQILQLLYEPPEAYLDLQIDLLLAESEYHRQALARRIPARVPDLDVPISVLACEDLVLFKLLAGRLVDRADAVALVRTNHASLDRGYLADWSRNLQLDQELAQVWREALPGNQPPL